MQLTTALYPKEYNSYAEHSRTGNSIYIGMRYSLGWNAVMIANPVLFAVRE